MCIENCGLGDIYKITCIINNKVYIGQAWHWIKDGFVSVKVNGYERRYAKHFHQAKHESQESINSTFKNKKSVLRSDMRQYGKDNFSIEKLGIYPIDMLDEKETEAISYYKTIGEVYNIARGGKNMGTVVGAPLWNEKSISIMDGWKDLEIQAKHLLGVKDRLPNSQLFIKARYGRGKNNSDKIIGYRTLIIHKGINYQACVGPRTHSHLSLEEKRLEIIRLRDELYQKLFGRPISELLEMMKLIESENC